jgi:mono/diheme cytochrome c family protein
MNHLKRICGWTVLLFAAVAAPMWGQAPAAPPASAAPAPAAPAPAARPRPNSFLISRAIPDPAAAERGQKLFVSNCGFCHGATATGGENGPDLIRSVLALHDEGGDQIGPVIRKGVPEKGMPAFPMSDEQIIDIAAFIRSRQQAAINRSDYEIQNVVTGDPQKGEAYFNGAGRCNTCHSPAGDLKGVASKYDPVALQTRFLFPAPRRSGASSGPPPAPVELTVTPASGSPVTGTLQYLDDFSVSLRDASGSYHSWTRSKDLKVEVREPLAAHEALLRKYTDDDMHNILAYLVTLK